MKTQWVYTRASTQNIMFHSKCVIQETSAFTTGHQRSLCLQGEGRSSKEEGGETKIRDKYFLNS